MANRSDRETNDPTVIRSVAVTVDDVVTALEANRSVDRGAVLRITPPFAGRMRARIHVAADGDYEGEIESIHLDPESLVVDVPPYPAADETVAASDTDADPDSRRHQHTERLDEWRDTVRNRLRSELTFDHHGETVDVQVLPLG